MATVVLAGGGSTSPGAAPPDAGSSSIRRSSPSAAPDPAAAVLTGGFRATATLDTSSGLRGLPRTATFGFAFDPVCTDGPCAVTLTIAGSPPISMFLARQGAAYSGRGEGNLGIRCGSRQAAVSLWIDLRISVARVVDGVDRATRVEGTIRLVAHPNGCRAGRAVESLVAEPAS